MMDDETAENKQCRQYEAMGSGAVLSLLLITAGKWLETDTNGKRLFNELVAKEQSLQKLMLIGYILRLVFRGTEIDRYG